MLLDPRGDFYLRRVMQDDLRRPTAKKDPRLDVKLMLYRVAEVFAVGLAVARACGWTESDVAGFGIQWIGLAGRSLGTWANSIEWDVSGSGTAHGPEAGSFTPVSLETPVCGFGSVRRPGGYTTLLSVRWLRGSDAAYRRLCAPNGRTKNELGSPKEPRTFVNPAS